jgi:dethiobiotin synthetase
MAKYFITGIGTGIGKTLVSAILTEKLQADYWKPIQSGDLEHSDSLTLKALISNNKTIIHPETYKLTQPLSPHLSARLDGVDIELEKIQIPETTNHLIIEGAGGLMVPLNEKELIVDLIIQFDVEVILVSENYLGSINHTLLSLELLKLRGINVKGIIFNGDENIESQRYITQYSKIKNLGIIPRLKSINRDDILNLAEQIRL